MCRRRNRQRQSALDGDAAVERQKLHRDLALVMVHGDDTVKVLPLEEDCVAGEWALHVDAVLPTGFHRRSDGVDFLASERAVLAVVRI